MKMTDLDVMINFCNYAKVGTLSYVPPSQPNHKTAYQWQSYNRKGNCELLKRWIPYLGDRRSSTAAEFLSLYESSN